MRTNVGTKDIVTEQIDNLYKLARLARNTDGLSPFEYGVLATDIISNVNIPKIIYYYNEHLETMFKIYNDLIRLVMNKEGIYPTTRGIQIGQVLVQLRCLDGARYDREVIRK